MPHFVKNKSDKIVEKKHALKGNNQESNHKVTAGIIYQGTKRYELCSIL